MYIVHFLSKENVRCTQVFNIFETPADRIVKRMVLFRGSTLGSFVSHSANLA